MIPDSAPARLDAIVRGRVQGVGFRQFVAQRAIALGVRGWVGNEPDGSVRCVAEGVRADLDALLAALELGPAGARIGRVSADWSAAVGSLDGFEIRSGWTPGD